MKLEIIKQAIVFLIAILDIKWSTLIQILATMLGIILNFCHLRQSMYIALQKSNWEITWL